MKEQNNLMICAKERILQALEDGLSVREICTLLEVDPMVVVKWKKRIDRNNI